VEQAGQPVSFYPTIKTALMAGTAVLEVLCPACQTVGGVDLRKLDMPDGASISSSSGGCPVAAAALIRRSPSR
jgi:hypothetical protein